MRRRFISLVVVIMSLYFGDIANAQLPAVNLSDSSKVSLLTCSQGDELYSIFGHSAIRVTDPVIGIDWVFNYGTFNFSDPNFYPNFVKGKLNYILDVSTYKRFEYSYVYENRFIYEQEVNLYQHEKQQLLDSLRINYLPENRYYLYDFLFDNCATRIRDIFVEAIPREIEFNYGALGEDKTFRQLLMPFVKEKPWAKLGINLLLGVRADRVAEPWQHMFLPNHMLTAFQHANFMENGDSSPFAQPPKKILKGDELKENWFRNSPLFVFIIVLLITVAVSFNDVKRLKPARWFDVLLFGLVGLLGAVIAFQWFGSDHAVMARNFNLAWAHPLHFLAAIVLVARPSSKPLKYYFGLMMGLLALLLIFWFFLPQELPLPMLPLVGALALRSAVNFRFCSKN
ncbi:MAG: DUF4105 domain-containing protein [Bacteroidales bacterium]